MADKIQPGNTCPACGGDNASDAITCTACGADLLGENDYADNDPALEHVDAEQRFELARYDTDTGAEAEIDCGLLRANGIACELGGETIPGLPSNMILWVNQKDAEAARTLLDEVEIPEDEQAS